MHLASVGLSPPESWKGSIGPPEMTVEGGGVTLCCYCCLFLTLVVLWLLLVVVGGVVVVIGSALSYIRGKLPEISHTTPNKKEKHVHQDHIIR